ncbi:nickel pincer cofactor biosynthesis protein LarB [Syntrophomonas erecta]
MKRDQLLEILAGVKAGTLEIQEAAKQLTLAAYTDLGFANIDDHRNLRDNFPEVVFCQGKTPEQVALIMEHLAAGGENILGTRANPDCFAAARKRVPDLEYHQTAGLIYRRGKVTQVQGSVAVVTAGTSDIPVAEEAAISLETMGAKVDRIFDVGVAGIHRVLDRVDRINLAQVVIVIAGMEGALASVVGGLTRRPVIAVPTSIGYGASFHGLAALLGMLNSCAPGVAVVNIDNGYGAAAMAYAILCSIHG